MVEFIPFPLVYNDLVYNDFPVFSQNSCCLLR